MNRVLRSLFAPGFLLCLLAGCVPYAEFALPPLADSRTARFFRWSPLPEPVLARGAPGEWDSVDALNPSLVFVNGVYYNLYSGFDGATWRTGLATSPDGLAWVKHGQVISPDPDTWEGDYIAANGSLLHARDVFLYWYQAGRPPRIGLARSRNARNWTKLSEPVLQTGPRGSWDERGVADPYVLRIDNFFYMYYLGQDRARRQRLGLARSPDGVSWDKYRTNPILELGPPGSFDENGLGEPAVWRSHGSYWILYTGRDRKEFRRIGLARSADGVRWERVPEAPVFQGSQPWNDKVVCDPTVLVEPPAAGMRVWFGGGNVARPDERLSGQIGVATLAPSE